ncbi:MAG: DAK2 domain-containing protein [Alphaproteobacteria bacterium]|nr:DAK2 domain-containing protein [Alphaproteobacteria bacterium]
MDCLTKHPRDSCFQATQRAAPKRRNPQSRRRHIETFRNEACQAAEAGLEVTKQMRAGAGRAADLGDRAAGIPDGGAAAVVIWRKAIAQR